MLARLFSLLARRPPHHAEQPVERLLDPPGRQVDVGHPGLGRDVTGVFGRVPARLGLVVGADPPDQVDLGQPGLGHRIARIGRQFLLDVRIELVEVLERLFCRFGKHFFAGAQAGARDGHHLCAEARQPAALGLVLEFRRFGERRLRNAERRRADQKLRLLRRADGVGEDEKTHREAKVSGELRSIRRAKEGNNLSRVTQTLFYATDFVDRLENEIVPALRAGFVVLTDRYIYSLMARAMMRGMDGAWIRSIFSVALVPDAIFYLRVGIDDLIPRVIFSRGFDYWESGMDLYSTEDMFESFRRYQAALLEQFDRLAEEFHFQVIDARPEPREIFDRLREGIERVLAAPGAQKSAVTDTAEGVATPAPVDPGPVVVPVAVAAPDAPERTEDGGEDRNEIRRKKA